MQKLMVAVAIRVSPAATEAGADTAARMAALPGARGSAEVMPDPESYPRLWLFRLTAE